MDNSGGHTQQNKKAIVRECTYLANINGHRYPIAPQHVVMMMTTYTTQWPVNPPAVGGILEAAPYLS